MNKSVVEYLKSQNIKVIEEDIETKIDIWKEWYRGKVDRFHNYQVYSGKRKIDVERKTLNMPARVCQDWADLLLNERVDITVDDENTQKVLNRLLKQVNFYVRGNNLIELAFALGGGFFIQYWDGKKTNQKYVTQDMVYPITFDSGRLIEAAFASSKTIAGKEYIYLETHLLDQDGYYVIDNVLLTTKNEKVQEVSENFYKENDIEPKVKTNSKTPLFQSVRPNIANRDKYNSAFGTSVFSGAIDAFKGCDICYDAYVKEVLLGKKRIFVRDGVANFTFDPQTGEQIPVFDPNDEVFYSLPGDAEENKPITESNMTLRISELDQALQTQLNLISQLCGFGANGYKWDNGSVSTATQVVSENSKMFRTLKKHELVLNDAIIDMAKGLLYVEYHFGKEKNIKLDASITVDFDDSIIEDTAEIKRQALTDYNVGLISKAEYFRQVYKMEEEQSQNFVKQMAEEINTEQALIGVEQEPEGA